ncbi:MAG: peptidase inhibitor family I36 protein [Sciscionella sp.]
MRRKTALGVSVLLSVMTLVALSPAAHADNGACPANRFCLFEHDNYEGGRAVFHGTDRDLRNNFWSGGSRGPVHDGASSMINNTGRRVVLFANVGCSGRTYNAKRESSDRDLTNNGFDNKADCVDFI